ncbi:MAG: hypothetical protein SOZ12_08500 [Anaerotignum sp.]|nr:hypothetical protein [Anaerotignum sp.]MDY3927342.1 hypothetical protein [Anaerotignum sp.]
MKKYLLAFMSITVMLCSSSCGTEANEKVTEEASPEIKEEIPHRTGDEIVGVSDKDISDIDITFSDSIRDDSTGNYRLATTADSEDLLYYIASYYDNYFKSDDEVHFIINFTLGTTMSISKFGDTLYLYVYEHVDGEEHSANKIPEGMCLGQYWIYLDNGDIEKIA